MVTVRAEELCTLIWCIVVKVASARATPKAKVNAAKINRGPILDSLPRIFVQMAASFNGDNTEFLCGVVPHQLRLAARCASDWRQPGDGGVQARRASNAKALADPARALANLGDGMLRVQSPEGRNALHHRVPLPWLWESCKTSAQGSRLQTSADGGKQLASRAAPSPEISIAADDAHDPMRTLSPFGHLTGDSVGT